MTWWDFIKRRWWEFRIGHGTYCAFLLSFVNFTTITYYLLPFLKRLFPHFHLYVLTFVLFYVPAAVVIGHLHRKKQLETDIYIQLQRSPWIRDLARALTYMADNDKERAKRVLERWLN